MFKKIIITLMVTIILSPLMACTGRDGSFDIRKPYALDLTPPEGPYEYEEGWSDGCESGMSAYAGNFYKLIGAFELRQNGKLRSNRMYYQAWKDAFLYCALYWESTNNDKI